MDETPLIQQNLQLHSAFGGYLCAMTRNTEPAAKIFQNGAVVVLDAVSMGFADDLSGGSFVRDEASVFGRCLAGRPNDIRERVALGHERNSRLHKKSKHTGAAPTAVQRAFCKIRNLPRGCVPIQMQLAEKAS